MYKITIKLSIVIIVILFVASVCSMETYALHFQEEYYLHQDTTKESPEGNTVSKYNDKTIDAAAQVTEVNENTNEFPPTISEERQEAEGTITVHTGDTSATIANFVPTKYRRIVTVGNLPTDHDPSLVLRKGRAFIALGRIIVIELNDVIKNRGFSEGVCLFDIWRNIYDDSGQVLLMPIQATIRCLYKISEEQDKIKINFTAMDMYLDLHRNVSVRFSDPPHCTTNSERWGGGNIELLSSADVRKREEEFLRLREQLFLSPVISAELVLGPESEDRTPVYGKIVFGENASGDRTVTIGSAYRVNLYIEKDILFSGPFVPRGNSMIQLINRNR